MDGAAWLVRRPANDAGPPATARIGTGADMQEEGPGGENEMFLFSLQKNRKREKERKNICTSVAVYILVPSKKSGHAIVGITIVGRELSESERVRKEKKI